MNAPLPQDNTTKHQSLNIDHYLDSKVHNLWPDASSARINFIQNFIDSRRLAMF